MSGDITPQQKRYLEDFVAGIEARGSNSVLASAAFSPTAPKLKPISPDAPHLLAQDAAIKRGKKACGPGKLEAGRAYLRCLSFSRSSRARRKSKAHRQFPLTVLRSLLCRSGARQLHVPTRSSRGRPRQPHQGAAQSMCSTVMRAEAGGLNGFLEQIEQIDAASAKAFAKDLRAQHRYQTDVY